VGLVTETPEPTILEVSSAPPEPEPEPEPEPDVATDAVLEIPVRIPPPEPASRPPLSTIAVGTLVAGIAPLVISIVGNALASVLGVQAVEAINAGRPDGAWIPLLVTLTIVFVGNAALLALCAVLGGRALRETANRSVRGKPFAIAGLAAGAVNLILWVVGLILTISSYSVIFS
jgi:hypothetical protein